MNRRDFLRSGAAAAVVAMVPSAVIAALAPSTEVVATTPLITSLLDYVEGWVTCSSRPGQIGQYTQIGHIMRVVWPDGTITTKDARDYH